MVFTDLPESVPSVGTRRVYFIPGGVADRTAITAAELATAEKISCYITRTGWTPGLTENVISDPRYCSAQDFEQPGTVARTLNLTYVFNTKSEEDDVARLALKRGVRGTIVHGVQVDEDIEDLAAGDFYEAVDVRMGVQQVMPPEDNAVDRITQKAFIQSEWTELTELTAA